MASRAELARRIAARITVQLRLPAEVEPGEVGDLAELGLTSMHAVVLVVGLEEEFGVRFPDEGLVIENFRTVESIAALVETSR